MSHIGTRGNASYQKIYDWDTKTNLHYSFEKKLNTLLPQHPKPHSSTAWDPILSGLSIDHPPVKKFIAGIMESVYRVLLH